jgi:adenylosuccinate synthase
LEDETGEQLRKVGNEFGATTGRPRRCGWMDLVALEYACILNGVTQIVMTKADVLDAFDELKICTKYRINGEETRQVPFQMTHAPIGAHYESFKGWSQETSQIKTSDALPEQMKSYISFINQNLPAKVHYISNGPGRDQLIRLS